MERRRPQLVVPDLVVPDLEITEIDRRDGPITMRVKPTSIRTAPPVREVAGKQRKRRRAWRRIHGDANVIFEARMR